MCGQVGKCGGHLSGDVKYPARIAVLETMVQMEILLRSPKNTVGKEGRFSTVWDNTVENKCGLRKKPDNLTRNAGVKRNLPDCCTWDGACGNTERSASVAEKFSWNWVRLALFQMCSSVILHFFFFPASFSDHFVQKPDRLQQCYGCGTA